MGVHGLILLLAGIIAVAIFLTWLTAPRGDAPTGEFGLPFVGNPPPMPPVKPPLTEGNRKGGVKQQQAGKHPLGPPPAPKVPENEYGIVVPSVWHHMQCRECLKFFAVEDAPDNRSDWYCPWCGDHQEMRKAA